jgi:D-serine deaminase-like pyridoxal phosphate-dependent protein
VSGVRDPERFQRYARLLDAAGEATPRLIVDLDAVDHNLAQVQATLGSKALRLVEKSLPCAPLLDHLMTRSGSRRLMSFHLPFLRADAENFPDAELMLGKPMPIAAAAGFYDAVPAGFDPANQLHWLIDTEARLAEYLALAEARGLRLQIVLELNIGLHRGGFLAGAALDRVLQQIAEHPQHLRLSGLMGYDAHVGLLPRLLGRPQTQLRDAMARYRAALDQVRAHPGLTAQPLILNSGGSPSLAYHGDEALSTELAVGSALLQPSGFDRPGLAAHRPAVFIATPVLKTVDPVRLPGPTALGRCHLRRQLAGGSLLAAGPGAASALWAQQQPGPADAPARHGPRGRRLGVPKAAPERGRAAAVWRPARGARRDAGRTLAGVPGLRLGTKTRN